MNTSLAFLGPIGGPEVFLIFMVLLLLFGAKKLPQLARGIGKSAGEFRRAREEFEEEIRRGGEDLEEEEKKKASKVAGTESQDDSTKDS